MPFDERCEDAGRCASRATSGTAWIEHLHTRASRGELVRNGAADHTCADDGYVHNWEFYSTPNYQIPNPNHSHVPTTNFRLKFLLRIGSWEWLVVGTWA